MKLQITKAKKYLAKNRAIGVQRCYNLTANKKRIKLRIEQVNACRQKRYIKQGKRIKQMPAGKSDTSNKNTIEIDISKRKGETTCREE